MSEQVLRRHVNNYIAASADERDVLQTAKSHIVDAVNGGSVQQSILTLVQALGEYLTSEDAFLRAKAIELLSGVLAEIRSHDIPEAGVDVLLNFYTEKLTDTPSVSAALEGLNALAKYRAFNGDMARRVASSFYMNVEVQTFPQGARYNAFVLLDTLLNYHLEGIQQLGDDFVFGFTKSMDGEKDPRNLMLAFSLFRTVVRNFDIAAHVEDLFEVTFCYFPITFKPPPDDPYGITADDLKLSLRECLASSPYFANFAFPLLLEKLSSTSGSAKKDSMETITACVPVYGASSLSQHVSDLLDALKVEVLHATDTALEEVALIALRQVVATLSTGSSIAVNPTDNSDTKMTIRDPTERALKPTITECLANLKEPELKNSKPSGRVLRAIAEASDPAFSTVTSAIIPALLRLYSDNQLATARKSYLDVFIELLEASSTLYGTALYHDGASDKNEFGVTPLVNYKDRFFEIFGNSLMASNEYEGLRLAGLKGLYLMCTLNEFLASNELEIAVQYLDQIVVEDGDTTMRNAVRDFLPKLALQRPGTLRAQTLPVLYERRYERLLPEQRDNYAYLMECIGLIGVQDALFEDVVAVFHKEVQTLPLTERSKWIEMLKALQPMLVKKKEGKTLPVPDSLKATVLDVIKKGMELTAQEDGDEAGHIIGDIVQTVVQTMEAGDQQTFIQTLFGLYFSDNARVMQSTHVAPAAWIMLASAVIALRREVPLPIANVEQMFTSFLDTILELTTPSSQRTSFSLMMCSVLNKSVDEDRMIKLQQLVVSRTEPLLQQPEVGQRALIPYLWTAKALILRTHASGYDMVDVMISLLITRLGASIGQEFGILIGDAGGLNKHNYAVVRLLYKQRFFHHVMPKLVDGYQSSENKAYYLKSMVQVLQHIPKQVLLAELPSIFSILVQGLVHPDPTLLQATMQAIQTTVKEIPTLVQQHLQTILPHLLELTKHQPIPIRVLALQTLALIPKHCRYDTLHPYKTSIIHALANALDDPKRLVRREAVECRHTWFVMS